MRVGVVSAKCQRWCRSVRATPWPLRYHDITGIDVLPLKRLLSIPWVIFVLWSRQSMKIDSYRCPSISINRLISIIDDHSMFQKFVIIDWYRTSMSIDQLTFIDGDRVVSVDIDYYFLRTAFLTRCSLFLRHMCKLSLHQSCIWYFGSLQFHFL